MLTSTRNGTPIDSWKPVSFSTVEVFQKLSVEFAGAEAIIEISSSVQLEPVGSIELSVKDSGAGFTSITL